ncbi:hypothetical protein BAUCODRAFT_434772 [Baudoinia panamericana UAMH 10762]|uniref:Tubby C-terminal-like domain-containing protein n=1 Tax=Baudoinia panamericana (strain UAMH 10762) TaxID=717646 RepID=M2NDI7_BAUPA|nr:uncharacterized protein BAUCODRAFT_434772 [Baudoinia panamericana UAMH 10762]EMC96970.1 hypothetical protein BAUCODRAFT_434772 [Baudoinia panamericana UAMH 10762]
MEASRPSMPSRSRTTPVIPTVTSPDHPMAIRSEYMTSQDTMIKIRELDNNVHTRDFVITDDDSTLMQISGRTISRNLKREFTDATGLPLFELRRNPSQKQAGEWSVSLPGADDGNDVLWINFKMFFVHTRFDIKFRNLAPPSTDQTQSYQDAVALEVRGQDLSNLVAYVTYNNKRIMHVRREGDESGTRAAYKHAYGYRTQWEVMVAAGVDVSLAAIIVIILAEQRG